MNTEKIPIDNLKFDLNNVRKHDDNSIKAIANSLSAFGQRKPIVIDQNNTVIAGNGTLKAGIYLGLKELDCVKVPDDWSKEKIKAFANADNKTHDLSEFDNELLLNTLQELNEFEIEVTGFEADELEDLMMFKKNPFKTIKIDINELKPHPKNYQEHPEDQLEHIINSINTHGFYRNIVIAKDFTILAGHGVVEAVKKMGSIKRVPVIKLNIDSNSVQALKVLTSDNEISQLAQVNDKALTNLLKEILELDDTILGTGYNEDQLSALAYTSTTKNELGNKQDADDWVGIFEHEQRPEVFSVVVKFESNEDREKFVEEKGIENFHNQRGNVWSTYWPYRDKDDVSNLFLVDDDEN